MIYSNADTRWFPEDSHVCELLDFNSLVTWPREARQKGEQVSDFWGARKCNENRQFICGEGLTIAG